MKADPIDVKDTYESPIGELERKLPGRETWFRKGTPPLRDASTRWVGSERKPLLTPGTRAWYDEWRAERARQRKSRAAREWTKTGRRPVEDYAKPGQAVGKPLSIEELKFTPLGRAKLQLDSSTSRTIASWWTS